MKKKAFSALYLSALGIIYLVALPFLALLSFKQKYKKSIPARFFLRQKKLPEDATLWVHGCSYGEVASLKVLIDALLESGGEKILLTTTTQTGFDLIERSYKSDRVSGYFLPFDLFLPFIRLPKVRTLIVTESELWPALFRSAKLMGAKTLLINSRISTNSYERYMRLKPLYKNVFSHIDRILAQSQQDTERLENLGAQNIAVMGNLKILTPIKAQRPFVNASGDLIILAASTHRGEEELILDAFLESSIKNSRLIIAPRHPERFERVREMLRKRGLDFASLDEKNRVIFDSNTKILLADKIGELKNLLSASDMTVLGGSFVKVGGHNPLEPAHFGNILITGEHFFNQRALFSQIENYYVAKDKEHLQALLLNHAVLTPASIKKGAYSLQDLLNEVA